jgi:hypothetical protein
MKLPANKRANGFPLFGLEFALIELVDLGPALALNVI